MPAEVEPRRPPHPLLVEREGDVAGEATPLRELQRARVQDVAVELAGRASARVEALTGGRRMENAHVLGEEAVQRAGEVPGIHRARQRERGHLAEGVRAGVGPPRSGHRHPRPAGQPRQGRFERALHGASPVGPLGLPTPEVRPVVGEGDTVERHCH